MVDSMRSMGRLRVVFPSPRGPGAEAACLDGVETREVEDACEAGAILLRVRGREDPKTRALLPRGRRGAS